MFGLTAYVYEPDAPLCVMPPRALLPMVVL